MNKNYAKIKMSVLILTFLFITSTSVAVPLSSIKHTDQIALSPLNSKGGIIYVDDDNSQGPWDGTLEHPYQFIQDGVDNANTKDTVYVFEGIYTENIYVNKQIQLIGESKSDVVVIAASSEFAAIQLRVDFITVENFSISNPFFIGIHLNGVSYCNLSNLNILQNAIGISFYNINQKPSNHNRLQNTMISDTNIAVSMSYASANIFTTNHFLSNSYAILLSHSNENIFTQNMFTDHLITIQMLNRSHENNFIKNELETSNIGLYIDNSHDQTILHNTIKETIEKAIVMINSNNSLYACNLFQDNLGYAIYSDTCLDNNFYYNNFINNTNHAYDTGINIWDNGYPSGGNYWDDYTGIDEDDDGIGDSPYVIDGGNNQDNYPFMESVIGNLPPTKPEILSGTSAAGLGIVIDFNAKAYDYEGDMLFYLWDWGDGTVSNWTGPYPSDHIIKQNNSWNETQTYSIRVKAKDVHGLESEWSDTFSISIDTQIQISNIQTGYLYIGLMDFNYSYFFSNFLNNLGAAVILGFLDEIYLEASASEHVQSVKFELYNPIFGDNITILDEDSSNGFSATSTVYAIFWKLSAYAYNQEGILIDIDSIDYLIFLQLGKRRQ
jgi:nitrous oxidase accessory protein NosD